MEGCGGKVRFAWTKPQRANVGCANLFAEQEEDSPEPSLPRKQARSPQRGREFSLAAVALAEQRRYWEALNKWDEALKHLPNDGKILEMKSQVLLELNEVMAAVRCAERAVSQLANWPPAYQSLGRALLGLGEVTLAQRSFSKAIHLNAADQSVWGDLKWTLEILEQKCRVAQEYEIRARSDELRVVEVEPHCAASGERGYSAIALPTIDAAPTSTVLSSFRRIISKLALHIVDTDLSNVNTIKELNSHNFVLLKR